MKEKLLKTILLLFGLIAMLLYSLLPFSFLLIVSLSQRADFLLPNVKFQFSLKNYYYLLSADSLHFKDYLRNSIIISFLSSLGATIIALFSAYAFSRFKFSFKSVILIAILAISFFPPISLIGYLFKFMAKLGWINSYPALIFPYLSWILPLAVWIMTSYFNQIPSDFDKAGFIDGCSNWKVLFKILLPITKPAVFSVFLLGFIFSYNEFLFALTLTVDYRAQTLPVGIALFQGLHGEIPWGEIMSASVIAILPVLMIVLFSQKYIISGLTRGAIKG